MKLFKNNFFLNQKDISKHLIYRTKYKVNVWIHLLIGKIQNSLLKANET